jgi:2-oxoglutarate dehydrogenase E1 component
MLAIGTLLLDGVTVRLSGQDSRRGTFTTRHGVLRDEKTNERYTPLDHIREGKQAQFNVWDSPLSEYSVMGFDYGYSRANPKALVMWEGQFGDFANGAQIMIDQYIASSEVKWNRWAGLVLLLPHGYRGRSIPRRVWSGSCSSAPMTTWRSCIRPRARRRSTCSAGRCSATSASR